MIECWGWVRVWMGVRCPCPPVRNDIVTPRHLFFWRKFPLSSLKAVYIGLKWSEAIRNSLSSFIRKWHEIENIKYKSFLHESYLTAAIYNLMQNISKSIPKALLIILKFRSSLKESQILTKMRKIFLLALNVFSNTKIVFFEFLHSELILFKSMPFSN